MSEAKVTPIVSESNDVALLKDEKGGLMMEYGISTISYFRGDHAQAASALKEQLQLVAAANPWLCGRLVKGKDGTTLQHPTVPSPAEIDAIFASSSAAESKAKIDFTLDGNSKYVDMCTALFKSKVVVGNGYSLVAKCLPVTKLTVVESTKSGEFGVIFSISHVVADGRTYYEIFKMLQPGSDSVRSLDSTRVQTFSEKMLDAYNRKALEWAESASAGMLFMTSMMFAPKPYCYAFHLDDEKVAEAKRKGAEGSGVDYVTTNDVLTSGFFNVTNSRIGWMGFDCRDRLEGFGSNLAGNYVTALVIDNEVFATPATLRQMYSSGTPYVTTKRKMPGCCCNPSTFSQVSNWSSFAMGLIKLEGCELSLHLPLLNPAYCVFDMMIPFATGVGPGKKGVICFVTKTTEDALKAALPIGGSVSEVLFPKK